MGLAKARQARSLKAWGLFDGGTLINYYALCFIVRTKKQARIEQEYYNGFPLNHKYEIRPVWIGVPKEPPPPPRSKER